MKCWLKSSTSSARSCRCGSAWSKTSSTISKRKSLLWKWKKTNRKKSWSQSLSWSHILIRCSLTNIRNSSCLSLSSNSFLKLSINKNMTFQNPSKLESSMTKSWASMRKVTKPTMTNERQTCLDLKVILVAMANYLPGQAKLNNLKWASTTQLEIALLSAKISMKEIKTKLRRNSTKSSKQKHRKLMNWKSSSIKISRRKCRMTLARSSVWLIKRVLWFTTTSRLRIP